MRRPTAVVAVLLVLVTPSAFAFRTTPAIRSVAVVATSVNVHGDERTARNVVSGQLVEELRRRGFDAFEVESAGAGEADYVVEIVGGDPSSTDYGDVGIDGHHGGVSLALVIARVAAEVRVYEGENLTLLSTDHLYKRSSSVLPSAIGIGGGALYAFVALPFIERAQLRRVARAAGREAVTPVMATINGR